MIAPTVLEVLCYSWNLAQLSNRIIFHTLIILYKQISTYPLNAKAVDLDKARRRSSEPRDSFAKTISWAIADLSASREGKFNSGRRYPATTSLSSCP